MGFKLDQYIAFHPRGLAIAIFIILGLWFVLGIVLVDALPIYIYLPIFVPPGLIGAWFAQKW